LSGQPIFLHDPYAAFNAAVTQILEAPKSKYPQPLEWPVSVWADVYGIFLDPMELRNRHFQNKPASEQTSPCLGIALQRLDTGQEAIDQILDLFSKINCVCELDWKHRTKELQTQIAATRFFMYMDKPASTTVPFFFCALNARLKYFSFFFSGRIHVQSFHSPFANGEDDEAARECRRPTGHLDSATSYPSFLDSVR
jgi:hypothetical protein